MYQMNKQPNDNIRYLFRLLLKYYIYT